MPVSLRPETPADELFLRDLILANVAEELFAYSWDENMRATILPMQYRGRLMNLAANHPHAERSIILADDVPVGWRVVDRSGETIHLVDIAILAAHRGSGIGAAVIQEILNEGERSSKAVTLEVLTTNRAVRLYQRLGFRRTGGDDVQHFLRRDPVPEL
jgi:ribosomal protein S18 acetylase RimI-like enzyme